jgi:hypothetical protein
MTTRFIRNGSACYRLTAEPAEAGGRLRVRYLGAAGIVPDVVLPLPSGERAALEATLAAIDGPHAATMWNIGRAFQLAEAGKR